MSNVTSIKFRMYNTGSVGDCLLLLFQEGNNTAFKMLIDCGGWNAPKDKIKAAAADILATTGGEIDLLVVTHQHEDHISGFNQAKDEFDQITVKDVWMSWIENKADPIAKIVKAEYGKTLAKLYKEGTKALKQLGNTNKNLPLVRGFGKRMDRKRRAMNNAMELIQFEMRSSGIGLKGLTNNDAMEYVRDKGSIDYRTPGDVLKMPGAEGIKFYILGPPRDADLHYFKIREKDNEMYDHALRMQAAKNTAVKKMDRILNTGIDLEESISPFSSEYHVDAKEQREFNKVYNSDEYDWRQIEMDWLESAASLALRVTNLTNNTSLAMALEFPSGKVLLLPADAQSGNWMGWHKPDVSKKLEQNGGKTTDQLLENTVFYKVGHHGSHNGTASLSGLEKMKHPGLVAMMPLIEVKVPPGWQHDGNFPAKALYDKLIDKTRGRLIRVDEGIAKAPRAKKRRTEELSSAELKKFNKAFLAGPCYVEFTIEG